MIIKVVIVTDVHAGSIYGLCPTHHFNEHTNAFQLWVIDLWRDFVLGYGSPDYLILGGDMVDGPGHKNTAVLNITDVNSQVDAAVDLLLPLVGNNTEIYGLSGSGYHFGKGTGFDADELVTTKLLDKTGVKGHHDKKYFGLLLGEKYGFGNIFFTHKGKNLQTQLKVLYERGWKNYGPRADALVTAHLHRKVAYQDGPLIIHTPCWEWETDFMNFTSPIDIGSTILYIDVEKRSITWRFVPEVPIPNEVFIGMDSWLRMSPEREQELVNLSLKKEEEDNKKLYEMFKRYPQSNIKKIADVVRKQEQDKLSMILGKPLPKANIKQAIDKKIKDVKVPTNLPDMSIKKKK